MDISYPSAGNIDNNLIQKENNRKKTQNLISIGKCSKFYLFIIGSGISKLVSLMILGNNNANLPENGIGLFGFCPILYNYNFAQSLYIYIGYIIFGIIMYFFKNVEKKEILDLLTVKRKSSISIDYMYKQSNKLSKKAKIQILFTSLAFVFYIEIKKVLYIKGFQFFNFWTVEIIFMLHFLRKYFIIDFYKHQKVSVIFIVITVSALLLTASFLPTSLSNDNPGNSYQNINAKLGSYFYSILFIFIFMILSYVYCFSRTASKVLMQINFVSPYMLIFLFGIVGLIISLGSGFVSYFIDYPDNFINYYSDLGKLLDTNNKYRFYAEIFLVSPLYSFSSFMEIAFEILTIYYLNPFYVLMTNNIYYGITEIIFFVVNSSTDSLVLTHFLLAEFSEIFAFLGYMVYLEIIELNFCGLDENLKKIIMEKGEDETREMTSFFNNDKNVGQIELQYKDFDEEEEEEDINHNNTIYT